MLFMCYGRYVTLIPMLCMYGSGRLESAELQNQTLQLTFLRYLRFGWVERFRFPVAIDISQILAVRTKLRKSD